MLWHGSGFGRKWVDVFYNNEILLTNQLLCPCCSCKLCRVYFCPSNIDHTIRSSQRIDWVCFSESFMLVLSWLSPTSAILASFLLHEELGHLGRVGCTLCLLGSLIIVLHAPADKPVEAVDEILHFALQPGVMQCFAFLTDFSNEICNSKRVSVILLLCCRLLPFHDLLCCPKIWTQKSHCVYLYLLSRRICFHYGHQGFRCRCQVNICR